MPGLEFAERFVWHTYDFTCEASRSGIMICENIRNGVITYIKKKEIDYEKRFKRKIRKRMALL